MAMTPQSVAQAWATFTKSLGLSDAKQGDRKTIRAEGLPQLSGVVEQVAADHNTLIYRLEGPCPGVAVFMAHACNGPTMIAATLYLYGDGAAAAAARDEPLWQAWLAKLFPAPTDKTHVA